LLVNQTCHSSAERTVEPDDKVTQDTRPNSRQWNVDKTPEITMQI